MDPDFAESLRKRSKPYGNVEPNPENQGGFSLLSALGKEHLLEVKLFAVVIQ